MTNLESKAYRHGDIVFIPITKAQFNKIADKDNGVRKGLDKATLALGEATGHSHVMRVKKPKSLSIYRLAEHVKLSEEGISPSETEFDDDMIIVIESEGVMDHEEHGELPMNEGIYVRRTKREYDPFENEWNAVID